VPKLPAEPDRKQILAWVERIATFFTERNGWPPITGRILGWLLICEPPEQSAGEIAEAIGASRASLTSTMRLLTALELVRRRTRPGARTAFYRIEDGAWERLVRQRVVAMTELCGIAEAGMRLFRADSPRAARLQEAHDVFRWLGELLATSRRPLASEPRAKPGPPAATRRRR
jgi:DNA-binding transcriptional ArsR family regulator